MGWNSLVYKDATIGFSIGIIATLGFLIAGAGILRPEKLLPEGEQTGLMIASVFSLTWGKLGGFLFLLGGTAALISTQVGQLASSILWGINLYFWYRLAPF
jgi:hypothetical protein